MQNKRLKILYLVDNFYPIMGGLNKVVDESSTYLSKYADITIGATKYKDYKDVDKPYKVVRCKGFFIHEDGLAYPRHDKKFREYIENEHFDIIHVHTFRNFLNYAKKIGKKYNIPVVTTIHNYIKPDVKHYTKCEYFANFVARIFMKKIASVDYVWAVSNFCADQAKKLGVEKPITVMENATNMQIKDNNIEVCRDIFKEYNLNNDMFIMNFVSRMVKFKNVDIIIDAVNILKDKNLNFKIFLVGDGPYLKHIIKKIKKLRIEKYFITTGMVRDRNKLGGFYNVSDVSLFPSVIDAAGLIKIEAATYKKPVLAIENTAVSEGIIDGENGFITKNNAKDFANKILELYNNREKLKSVGENALKTLYKTYADKNVTDKILNEYYKIIEDFNK